MDRSCAFARDPRCIAGPSRHLLANQFDKLHSPSDALHAAQQAQPVIPIQPLVRTPKYRKASTTRRPSSPEECRAHKGARKNNVRG